jgi:hypothetical protein
MTTRGAPVRQPETYRKNVQTAKPEHHRRECAVAWHVWTTDCRVWNKAKLPSDLYDDVGPHVGSAIPELRLNQTDQRVSCGTAEAQLPSEHQDLIRVLAQELRKPLHLVAEVYVRELERLRPNARVTTFLPLLVSRLVRRRSAELAEA